MAPAVFKAGHSRAPLLPADNGGVRKFTELMLTRAELEIAAHVGQPAKKCSNWSNIRFRFGADYGECATLAVASFIGLRGSIIVRVHDYRIGAVNNSVALGPAPAGVFVVLGVLHLWEKAAFGPNIFSQAAANHAEEVVPFGRFALLAKAAFI